MFRFVFLLIMMATLCVGCSDVPISTVLDNVEACDTVSVEETDTHYILDVSDIEDDGTISIPKACLADAPNAHLPVYMPRDPAKLYEWINGEIQTTSEAAVQRWVRETVTIRAKVIRTDGELHLDPIHSDTDPLSVITLENVATNFAGTGFAKTTLGGRIREEEIRHLNWYLYFQGESESVTRDQTYNFTVRIDSISMRKDTRNNLLYMVLARIIEYED